MSAIEVREGDTIIVHGVNAASADAFTKALRDQFGLVHTIYIECDAAAVTVLRKAEKPVPRETFRTWNNQPAGSDYPVTGS